jgi:hypothetical protein
LLAEAWATFCKPKPAEAQDAAEVVVMRRRRANAA